MILLFHFRFFFSCYICIISALYLHYFPTQSTLLQSIQLLIYCLKTFEIRLTDILEVLECHVLFHMILLCFARFGYMIYLYIIRFLLSVRCVYLPKRGAIFNPGMKLQMQLGQTESFKRIGATLSKRNQPAKSKNDVQYRFILSILFCFKGRSQFYEWFIMINIYSLWS